MELSELQNNEKGIITKIRGRGAFRKRITEMGFVKGKIVKVIRNAPLKDPVEYEIMGYLISLRRSEAALIEVVTEVEASKIAQEEIEQFDGTLSEEFLKTKATEKHKVINIALVGNPNCGKTTLFNFASGAREHVGNYSGVTVDSKHATFQQCGYKFNLTDLPGTYSLTAYSPEELFVRNFIFDQLPDVVINVLDASNLERNLFLTTQLIDMDIKVVVALNMYDELQEKGAKLDYKTLGEMLGIPFVPTVSSRCKGINELFNKVIEVYEDTFPTLRHIHINYGIEIEKSIQAIQKKIKIKENFLFTDKISSRYLSLKLLEKDKQANQQINVLDNVAEIQHVAESEIQRLEKNLGDDSETIITDAKYGFIAGALKETYKEGIQDRRRKTEIVDTIMTHRVFGYPIFILFMWVMFQGTFTFGSIPVEWIENFVDFVGKIVREIMPAGTLKDLLVDGIIGGVGGVLVFLPNILLLFFFISLMEDTGYMARVAFIMDKMMHKIGLHGKSFIPLMMGIGCNVPAIMSTRTLENRNDRLLTMLINPFMSCSARLPVYVLIIGVAFPTHAGLVLFSIYFIGIVLAILMALLLKNTMFNSKETPFVMELPPYRIPTLQTTVKNMWFKAQQYLRKMGGIIFFASIIIWALGYFPRTNKENEEMKVQYNKIESSYNQQISAIDKKDSLAIKNLETEKNVKLQQLEYQIESHRQEHSFVGRIGRFIEPVIRPLGFDWKMGVSILSGVAGKEIVVSTMGVLYQTNATDKDSETLKSKLRNEVHKTGDRVGHAVFSPLAAFSYLLFILIYFPCIATIAAINKESGSWRWAAFTIFYTTALAWLVSFVVFQVGSLF